MGKDRHPRLALHQPDQPFAAARHDHVDEIGHRQHLAHCGAVPCRHQLDRGFGQARSLQPIDQTAMDRRRGMKAFRPAAQDHRIAGFQAQRPGIGGHVGTAFIDHAHHAKRRAHTADVQPRRHVPLRDHVAHRVLLRRDQFQPVANVGDPVLGQLQPVHHGRAQPLFGTKGHVLFVCRDDLGAFRPDRIGCGVQRLGLDLWCSEGQFGRSSTGGLPKLGHHLRNVVQILHNAFLFHSADARTARSSRCTRAALPG